MVAKTPDLVALIEQAMKERGYTIVETDNEKRVIRPDGSVAVVARRRTDTSSEDEMK